MCEAAYRPDGLHGTGLLAFAEQNGLRHRSKCARPKPSPLSGRPCPARFSSLGQGQFFGALDSLQPFNFLEFAMLGKKVPFVTFRTRVRDESIEGPNPYRWEDKTSDDYFKGKKVVLFSLPGAFTPTCSTYQLPDFEKLFEEFKAEGVDDIYCISVNDAFVMNAWAKAQGVEKVKVIPDGSGEFTRKMGMLVAKDNLGFGMRSWRYGAVVNDGVVEQWFEEEGFSDNCESDPYGVSSPQNILEKLRAAKVQAA
jgi:peroxiredoxin